MALPLLCGLLQTHLGISMPSGGAVTSSSLQEGGGGVSRFRLALRLERPAVPLFELWPARFEHEGPDICPMAFEPTFDAADGHR